VIAGVVILAIFGAAVFLALLAVRQWVSARQYALLAAMAAAARRGMPLAPVIRAAAGEYAGSRRYRILGLAHMLDSGRPLPEALLFFRGLVPRGALPLVQVGHDAGRLAEALERATRTGQESNRLALSLVGKVLYLSVLPFFFLATCVFIVVWIAPAMASIFMDFGMDKLPPLTQAFVEASELVWGFWYLLAPLLLFLAVLAVYTVLRGAGWVSWDLPGVARLMRRYDTAAVLEALAITTGAGRPLPEGVASLERSYPKARVRRRLHGAWLVMCDGGDWCEALLAHRLIGRADAAVLQAAARVGNLPWALDELADSSRRRLTYRLEALTQILFPLAILVAGLAVFFVAAAFLMPLATMIERLC